MPHDTLFFWKWNKKHTIWMNSRIKKKQQITEKWPTNDKKINKHILKRRIHLRAFHWNECDKNNSLELWFSGVESISVSNKTDSGTVFCLNSQAIMTNGIIINLKYDTNQSKMTKVFCLFSRLFIPQLFQSVVRKKTLNDSQIHLIQTQIHHSEFQKKIWFQQHCMWLIYTRLFTCHINITQFIQSEQ